MNIEMGKKYQTWKGDEVRILCTDRNHSAYPVVTLINDALYLYTLKGEPAAPNATTGDSVGPWHLIEVEVETHTQGPIAELEAENRHLREALHAIERLIAQLFRSYKEGDE